MLFLQTKKFIISKKKKPKNILKVKILQTRKKIRFICLSCLAKKAVIGIPDHIKKASLTIECALALPLFMFATIEIISYINLYYTDVQMLARLHENAKEYAVLAAGREIGILGGDQCIVLRDYKNVNSSFPLFSHFLTIGEVCCVRAFTGYENTAFSTNTQDEKMVFVTPSGEVYHTDYGCTYLHMNVSAVDQKEVRNCRNEEGSKYYACMKCKSNSGGSVYITSYGNRYHSSIMCSELKRTILTVPLSKVGGRRACAKCGGSK